MDQTVNLTSTTSVVRIYLFPPPKRHPCGCLFWRWEEVDRGIRTAVVRASIAAWFFGKEREFVRNATLCRGDPFRGFGKIYLQTAKAVCLAHLQAIPKGIAVCVAGRGHELPTAVVRASIAAWFFGKERGLVRNATPCRGDPFRGFGKMYLFPPPKRHPCGCLFWRWEEVDRGIRTAVVRASIAAWFFGKEREFVRNATLCRGDPFRGFGKIYLQTAKAVCLAHLQAIPKGIAVCVAGRGVVTAACPPPFF